MLTTFHPLKAAVFAGAALLGIAASAASAATVTVDLQFFTGKGGDKPAVWSLGYSYDDAVLQAGPLSFGNLLSFTLSGAAGTTLTLANVVMSPDAIFNFKPLPDAELSHNSNGAKQWLRFDIMDSSRQIELVQHGNSWHLIGFSNKHNGQKLTTNHLSANSSTSVTPSPVPLPIPGLLLLAGLGGLAALRPRGGQRAALAA